MTQIDLRHSPGPEAALTARHSLDRSDSILSPERLEDVRPVVSELVTNSVSHAGLSPDEQITLSVVVSGGSVCGRVCDPGPGFEKPSKPRPRPDPEWRVGPAYTREDLRSLGAERNGRQGSLVCVWFEIG